MKRPYLTFLLAVLVPSAFVAVAALQVGEAAWRRSADQVHQRVASMALVAADGHAPDLEPVLRMARTTGYHVAVYLDGARSAATTDELGLPRWEDPHPTASTAIRIGGIGVLAAPTEPGAELVPGPVLLVLGLLFVFAALAGWIQLARPRIAGARAPSAGAMVLPGLVPVLTAVVLLVHVDRSFEERARRACARSLTLGLAGSVALGMDSPDQMRGLTGFHVTRVEGGRVVDSTLPEEGFASLAALPAPPSSFTSSGPITTAEGPSLYAALRRDANTVVVATLPLPREAVAALRVRLMGLGIFLGGWLAVFSALLALSTREASGRPR